MFSDKFTEIKNYSLFQQKHINDSSVMPWRYTSVYDSFYKPEITEDLKDKFQLLFYYRLLYTAQLLEDDKKYLEIKHSDGIIEEYKCINPMKLIVLSDYGEWKHFVNTLEINNLEVCLEKILNYVENYLVTTGLTSVTYDVNGNATGVYFQHDNNKLLGHSEMADKLCIVSSLLENGISNVHVNPIDNSIKYRITPAYTTRSLGFRRVTTKSLFDSSNYIPMRVKYEPQTDKFLSILLEQQVITEEIYNYIKNVIPAESKIELEYLIDEFGELNDIILKNILIEEFEDITQKQNLSIYETLGFESKFYEV